MERRGVEKSGGNGASEAVSMKVEAAEEDEGTELGRDVAGEVLGGDGDADDAGVGKAGDIGAGDTRPPARVLVVLNPASKGAAGVVGDGRLEGQESETIR